MQKATILVLLFAGIAAVAPAPDDWTLVWSDEFDTPGPPDPRNWTYETGFVRNHELQWYRPENARCERGLLIIEARRERFRSGDARAEYTSASLNTRGLHDWTYGRFEMRARIDTRAGLWPSFWTLGVAGPAGWPSGGEIDIMEYYQGSLLANVASIRDPSGMPAWHVVRKPLQEFGDEHWPDQFHIWRMDWDQRVINLYVDGVLLNSVDLATTVNNDGSGVNPFHQPQYILLNLAVGGDSGGDPSDTRFPARFEIDYVRVYQRAAAPSPPSPPAH